MNTPEQVGLTSLDPEDSAGTVLRLVSEGYRVLAEIYDAIAISASDPTEGHAHVTVATRELASIQKLFERRGRGDR